MLSIKNPSFVPVSLVFISYWGGHGYMNLFLVSCSETLNSSDFQLEVVPAGPVFLTPPYFILKSFQELQRAMHGDITP